jgi:hypothetical protein
MNVFVDYISPGLYWVCPNCHFHHLVPLPEFLNASQGGRLLVCTNCYHYYKVNVSLQDYTGSLAQRALDEAKAQHKLGGLTVEISPDDGAGNPTPRK